MAIPLQPWKYSNWKEYEKDQDLALRNIFKNEIKPSFLIRIYHKVKDELGEDFLKYYQPTLTMEKELSGNSDIAEYDICKMVIGIHKSNMIFVGESEERKSLDNPAYEQKLIEEVINHVKLRQYASSYFRQKQIIYGDRFLYFNVPYDLFAICIRMNELLYKNIQTPYRAIFAKIANMGLSALSLLENNFLDNIYSICRGIIELYMTLIAIFQNKNAIKKYEFLTDMEFKYSQCGQELSSEFYEMFEKRLKKESDNEAPHTFLHFGWVDELKDYHKIVKRKPYTMKSLIKYIKVISGNNDYDLYDKFYQQCHSYTHANIRTSIYPLLSYFEISMMLYITILMTYQDLCEILKVDTKINNIDIVSKTNKDYELLVSQYNKRTTENFNKYYKTK